MALRLVAVISWWPVSTTLSDSYELYATRPFDNPLHPAGYPLIMAGIGLVTRQVAAIVLLQHLSGIASALLLWAATRRITGSAWAGLLPAAVVLLDPDFVFLEHTIMSESWFVLAVSGGLYATTRALDEPQPYWRWPLIAGVALAAAVTIRTAALPLILVAALALFIYRSPGAVRGAYLRSGLTVLGVSVALLLGYATANAAFGERFGLGASDGWYLYARAAQFADCDRFTPPAGTEGLCEDRPSSERPGTRFYSFDRTSPAHRIFGEFGNQDDRLGEWARRAIVAQPGDYLANVWENLRSYWVPGLRDRDSTLTTDPYRSDQGLDPQLAFNNGLGDSGLYRLRPSSAGFSAADVIAFLQAGGEHNLETFYDDFTVHRLRGGLEFLRGWQRVIRFGATALSIATLLVLAGLAVGTRRSRTGVLLFGVGGLSLILVPAFTANTWDRYLVPMAGPMLAAVGITLAAVIVQWMAGRTA